MSEPVHWFPGEPGVLVCGEPAEPPRKATCEVSDVTCVACRLWLMGLPVISPETRRLWTENKYVAKPMTFESLCEGIEQMHRGHDG